jgi:hypothetical protein
MLSFRRISRNQGENPRDPRLESLFQIVFFPQPRNFGRNLIKPYIIGAGAFLSALLLILTSCQGLAPDRTAGAGFPWRVPNEYLYFQGVLADLGTPPASGSSSELRFLEEPDGKVTGKALNPSKKSLLVQLEKSSDYGLALLRTPEYRQRVVDFYTEETGSSEIAQIILEEAQIQDIPLSLAFALAWVESRYNPFAVNHNSSSVDRGLFQLNSRSFPEVEEDQFFNPAVNAKLGMEYLRQCLEAGESEIVALAMYNAGRTRVTQGGTPMMTLEYISLIIDYRHTLEERFYARCFKEPASRAAVKAKVRPHLVIDTKKGIK